MALQTVDECSFLIPIQRDADVSDGRLHSTVAWEWLTDELWERFGGATIAPGLYEGFYTDPDSKERVSDQSRKYEVAVSKDKLKLLRELLREACSVFEQKCIYLSVAGKVEFVEPAKK